MRVLPWSWGFLSLASCIALGVVLFGLTEMVSVVRGLGEVAVSATLRPASCYERVSAVYFVKTGYVRRPYIGTGGWDGRDGRSDCFVLDWGGCWGCLLHLRGIIQYYHI
jgi:hypothetical protein